MVIMHIAVTSTAENRDELVIWTTDQPSHQPLPRRADRHPLQIGDPGKRWLALVLSAWVESLREPF